MEKIRTLLVKITDPDSGLVEQHEAYGEIVRLFQDMAYACAYSILGDFRLAEDAAQEAFFTAWKKINQLREPEAFPGWFKRIVLTECNRLTRGKKLSLTSLENAESYLATTDDLQDEIEKREVKKAIFTAIMELPENERLVIALFYLREYSQNEISRFLEVPTTTVAKRLYTARNRLRDKLPKEFGEDFMAHKPSRNRSFAEKVRAGIFDEYVGEYRFETRPELSVTIKREGNQLLGEANGQRNVLFAENNSANELLTKEFDGRGKFIRNRKGRVTHCVYYENGQKLGKAKKIK